ncbi:hypothetical protein K2173_016832 [Erythroxylum novogranatense]|uniref:histone deacetylase n=1 Tax=Erythroxylum novogranatense TaxID=1862640 RepID=A0AAV8SHA7_9ROSI|nr:hypothetical protein K2173_016832 [Erythroxylum novogranatense]
MSFRVMMLSGDESNRIILKPTFYFAVLAIAAIEVSYLVYRYLIRPRNKMSTAPQELIISSKLYIDIPPNKVPIIYSPGYDISFLGMEKMHPFDSAKWGRVCQFLIIGGGLAKDGIVEPREASKEDLLVVHTELYLKSLRNSANVARIIEVPPVAVFPNCLLQQKVLSPFRKQVGGTILAAKLAKHRSWAINIGGGFHHCSREKGGGFCAYADISLCIHYAFVLLDISSVMIIDLDAHQGNGHEMDFSNDDRVYILDMYNPDIYPFDFEARRYINHRVEVVSGTTTEQYLAKLNTALNEVAETPNFKPQLVIYNAGTDILDGDPLGRLKVSPCGVINRDEMVFQFAHERNIPIVMLTSVVKNIQLQKHTGPAHFRCHRVPQP